MSDLIRRKDVLGYISRLNGCGLGKVKSLEYIRKYVERLPSADRPQDDDWEKYSDKLWKNAYERGKADGAMIYGNEHNCIMTIFGECSYAETGCGDCAVVEKVRKALSADRPQEWIPCSERLPKIGEKVLASTKKTVFTQVFKGYHSDPKRWVWENNRVKEIEAWQPLPKPWEGEDDDN